VRPDSVVFQSPSLNQYLGFLQGVEDLPVEQLIPELDIETLIITVLPGAARFNIRGLNTNVRLFEPRPFYYTKIGK
jgi:hypothetical protein